MGRKVLRFAQHDSRKGLQLVAFTTQLFKPFRSLTLSAAKSLTNAGITTAVHRIN